MFFSLTNVKFVEYYFILHVPERQFGKHGTETRRYLIYSANDKYDLLSHEKCTMFRFYFLKKACFEDTLIHIKRKFQAYF